MAKAGAIRAGRAYVSIFADNSALVRGLKAASARLKAFGASVRRVGMGMMSIGVLIAAPLVLAVRAFMKAGDELDKMGARVGASVEFLSALSHAAQIGGASLQDIEKGMKRLSRSAYDASRGVLESKDAFDFLKVSVTNADGSLKGTEQLFMETVSALSQVENATDRAALAQILFGRAGTLLLPMLKDGKDGLIAMMEEAKRLGIVMSAEDTTAAAELTDALTRFKSVAKMTAIKIGAALAPMLTDLFKKFTDGAKRVLDFVKANKRLVILVAKVAGVLIAAGLALVLVGVLVSSLGAVLGAIAAAFVFLGSVLGTLMGILATVGGIALAALFNPWIVALAGITVAVVAILRHFGQWGRLMAWIGDVGNQSLGFVGRLLTWLQKRFLDLKDTAIKAFRGIGDALAAGDLALAAKVLWLTLKMEWQRGIAALMGMWIDFKFAFLNVWSEAVFQLSTMMINAQASMASHWINTVHIYQDAWTTFVHFFHKSMFRMVAAWEKWQTQREMDRVLFSDDPADEGKWIKLWNKKQAIEKREKELLAGEDEKRNETIAANEIEREEKLAGVESDRMGTQRNLADMHNKEQRSNDKERDRQMDKTGRKLDKAKKEWQAALDEAAEARAKGEKKLPKAKKPGAPDWEEMRDNMAGAGESSGIKAQGAFSVFALRGFGNARHAARTAKWTELTAKNTKKLLQIGGVPHFN